MTVRKFEKPYEYIQVKTTEEKKDFMWDWVEMVEAEFPDGVIVTAKFFALWGYISLKKYCAELQANGDFSGRNLDSVGKACGWGISGKKMFELLQKAGIIDEDLCFHPEYYDGSPLLVERVRKRGMDDYGSSGQKRTLRKKRKNQENAGSSRKFRTKADSCATERERELNYIDNTPLNPPASGGVEGEKNKSSEKPVKSGGRDNEKIDTFDFAWEFVSFFKTEWTKFLTSSSSSVKPSLIVRQPNTFEFIKISEMVNQETFQSYVDEIPKYFNGGIQTKPSGMSEYYFFFRWMSNEAIISGEKAAPKFESSQAVIEE